MKTAARKTVDLLGSGLWCWPMVSASGQVRTVKDRFSALRNHWPDDAGASDMGSTVGLVFLLFLFLLALGGLAYWWYVKHRPEGPLKPVETATKQSLTPKEQKILQIIAAGNKKLSKKRLLRSVDQFDEVAGFYLKRYCAQKTDPRALIGALQSIRKKFEALETVTGNGLEIIRLLSRIEVRNPAVKDGKPFTGQVIEKGDDHLRIQCPGRRPPASWQPELPLRLQGQTEGETAVEFLVRFSRLESPKTGLFLVEYEYSRSMSIGGGGGTQTLQHAVKITRTSGATERAVLERISTDGAVLKGLTASHAGEVMTVDLDIKTLNLREQVPATVVYSRTPMKGKFEVGVRFDEGSNRLMRIAEALNKISDPKAEPAKAEPARA